VVSRRAVIVVAALGCGSEPDTTPSVCTERALARQRPQQCGPSLDFTPINSYAGSLEFVQLREEAVVLINGTCTGTLVAASAGPVVLTAGHCAQVQDRVTVSFNFEDAADGDPLITEGTVIEQSNAPDYALVQLDAVPPTVTPTPLAAELAGAATDELVIIQHPRGQRKVIAEGSFLDSCDDLIYYLDLDTLIGSSGAGVLDRRGELVGVHTDGDCDDQGGGTNSGWTAASIVRASEYLQRLAAR
jgi:hypothetical protein